MAGCALNTWGESVKDKLVLARMGNEAAAYYANMAAGRPPPSKRQALVIKDLETVLSRSAAALNIPGLRNSVVDAWSRIEMSRGARGP